MRFVLLLSDRDARGASAAEIGVRTAELSAWVARQRAEVSAAAPASIDAAGGAWLVIEAPDREAAEAVAGSCPEEATVAP